jgi:formylmethanofuran--tetrahydromethanopterin N-formyltransferase
MRGRGGRDHRPVGGVARTAAQSMTGFATSVIGCKVEAGIEAALEPDITPDRRPGVSVLPFGFDAEGLQRQLIDRVGQTVLTCPTTACFDGLPDAPIASIVGGQLRHFGDKFQASKVAERPALLADSRDGRASSWSRNRSASRRPSAAATC